MLEYLLFLFVVFFLSHASRNYQRKNIYNQNEKKYIDKMCVKVKVKVKVFLRTPCRHMGTWRYNTNS